MTRTLERVGVDDLLAEARATLDRVEPSAAIAVQRAGGLLVDIRPHAQRVEQGEIPGALVLERNVLEWRLDPSSDARIPEVTYDLQIVVLCAQGYTSSLAAHALQRLGLHRATDLVGGFLAWRAAGLPVAPGGTPAGLRSGRTSTVLHVDPARAEVHVEGRLVPLTRRQLDLIDALHRAEGRVVPRAVLARLVGVDPTADRPLDVLVHRLRRRLGPAAAQRVITVRGRGFRLLR